MKKLAILIPSYKRPQVLTTTLKGLYANTTKDEGYDICVCVGLNKASNVENQIVGRFDDMFETNGILFHSVSYENNLGKANILNVLFTLYANHADIVITMDNDMVISKPWLHLINPCLDVDFDIMGFSSSKFWAHDPKREKCCFIEQSGFTFYIPNSVAGGMMLFHREFLEKHPWTNHGGVYGRDDVSMCLLTDKKYVILHPEDWLVHDPLNSSTPSLKAYEDKKKDLYSKGVTVFPVDWDE